MAAPRYNATAISQQPLDEVSVILPHYALIKTGIVDDAATPFPDNRMRASQLTFHWGVLRRMISI